MNMNSKEIFAMKLKNKVLEQLIDTISNKSRDDLYVRIIRTDGKLIKEKLYKGFYTMSTWDLSPCFNELYIDNLNFELYLEKQVIDNTCALQFSLEGCKYCNVRYNGAFGCGYGYSFDDYCGYIMKEDERVIKTLIKC